jgi:hypothetical protein
VPPTEAVGSRGVGASDGSAQHRLETCSVAQTNQTERTVTMAHVAHAPVNAPRVVEKSGAQAPAYQAYQLLHWGLVAAPVIAGADKFFGLLTNWDKYLAPPFAHLSPLSVHATMMGVGVVEMIAGLVVALRPRIGAYVVAAWLLGIIVNLLVIGGYYDIALRDFGLLLGALALGRLSQTYDYRRASAVD